MVRPRSGRQIHGRYIECTRIIIFHIKQMFIIFVLSFNLKFMCKDTIYNLNFMHLFIYIWWTPFIIDINTHGALAEAGALGG